MRLITREATRSEAVVDLLQRIDDARGTGRDVAPIVRALSRVGVEPTEYSLEDSYISRLSLSKPRDFRVDATLDFRRAQLGVLDLGEVDQNLILQVGDTFIASVRGRNVDFRLHGPLEIRSCWLTGDVQFDLPLARADPRSNSKTDDPSVLLDQCFVIGEHASISPIYGQHKWDNSYMRSVTTDFIGQVAGQSIVENIEKHPDPDLAPLARVRQIFSNVASDIADFGSDRTIDRTPLDLRNTYIGGTPQRERGSTFGGFRVSSVRSCIVQEDIAQVSECQSEAVQRVRRFLAGCSEREWRWRRRSCEFPEIYGDT